MSTVLRNGLAKLWRDGLRETYAATVRHVEPEFYRRLYQPALRRTPRLVRHACQVHPRFSDADPFKLLWVNPTRVEEAGEKDLPLYFGKLRPGDWDLLVEPFRTRTVARGVHAYLNRGDETVLREHYYDHRVPFNDIDDPCFEDRLDEIDSLCTSMRRQGYQSRRQQLSAGTLPSETHGSVPFPPEFDEITVNIGRDGSLQRVYNGQHRLAVAKALELDAVAVLVACRHPDWQQVRDEMRAVETVDELSSNAARYLSHPDLVAICP